jgi:hypothetical protein
MSKLAGQAAGAALNTQAPATKILVAIHGIGDQVDYATVQAVAAQVGAYYDIAASIPLGRFYSAASASPGKPTPIVMGPDDPSVFSGFGFAEVYWADIPRRIVKSGYVLEEAKKWAKTVSGRLALRAMAQGSPIPEREQERLTTVLDEMIETIAILERLNFVLARAGLLKFNLNQLLNDYLGDVQIVADFQTYRQEILTAFGSVLENAMKLVPDERVELYLIGHSEGSVLTFIALLTALSDPRQHKWINSVKGVMTIGSPIETHHLLWPELWHDLRVDPSLEENPRKIPWRNYYDYGDPIAYSLDATKKWMDEEGFNQQLQLTETRFGRSYLPGKAHVDYWEDNELFAHFIHTVVRPQTPSPRPALDREPASRWWAVAVSYAVPWGIIAALLCAATYFLYRPVSNALMIGSPPLSALLIGGDVVGIAFLLLGVTASARIPRLTSKWRWWLFAAVLLVASMAGYQTLVAERSRAALGAVFFDPAHRASPSEAEIVQATRGVQAIAGGLALVCGILASWWPKRGVRFLPLVGLAATLVLVVGLLADSAKHTTIEMWPIVLGAICFFYLWWIATLFFDLVFVWHRYVRHSVALQSVAQIANQGYVASKLEKVVDRKRSTHKSAPVTRSASRASRKSEDERGVGV